MSDTKVDSFGLSEITLKIGLTEDDNCSERNNFVDSDSAVINCGSVMEEVHTDKDDTERQTVPYEMFNDVVLEDYYLDVWLKCLKIEQCQIQ